MRTREELGGGRISQTSTGQVTADGMCQGHQGLPPEVTDLCPTGDYDEPWEWSNKQTRLLQTQLENATQNLPPNFLTNRQTPQLKRTNISLASSTEAAKEEISPSKIPSAVDTVAAVTTTTASNPASPARSVSESTGAVVETTAASPSSSEVKEAISDSTYEVTNRTGTGDADSEDESGYTHLRDEFGPSHLPEEQRAIGNNYEEPWDRSSKQMEIEDRLKAASAMASRDNSASKSITTPTTTTTTTTTQGGSSVGPKTDTRLQEGPKTDTRSQEGPKTDTRSQEGYEKPWDWKPHQKDERSQEGYEKPWDWKPHQKV